MGTMRVHVVQLEVKVFCLALNAFWLNQRTNTDFRMNCTHNVLGYASCNVLFSKFLMTLVWIVGENISANILLARRTTYIFSFKKEWGNILFLRQNQFSTYNPKIEWLGKGYFS